MTTVWADADGWLVGSGPHTRIDPGAGSDRYHRALRALRDMGRDLALASFTFDPKATGSVVLVPEEVGRGTIPEADPPPGFHVVDDGIADWRKGFARAVGEIGGGAVSKVVLARQVVVAFGGDLDVESTVARLARGNPGCYAFAVDGLLGATPELLVSLRAGEISALALAGTATDPVALESVKISEEHRHVAASVLDALAPHVSAVETEQVIVPHGAMSHVGTRVRGMARAGTTVADLLAGLHPTAAVAGTPRRQALALIRQIEPLSRGRYAGPIGWLDSEGDGVFALALRCGQLDGNRMTLFAGGGLVAGSEEEEELAETELKLAPMMAALGQASS